MPERSVVLNIVPDGAAARPRVSSSRPLASVASLAPLRGSLRVERLAAGESRDAWDAFVRQQPGATHCHRYAWRDVMHDVFGHECVYLVARDEHGRWEGVLPLVRVKSRLFGHFLVSMPFLNYGGPIGTPRALRALADAAAAAGRETGAGLVELRCRASDGGAEPASAGWTTSTRKITVVLDLPGGEGASAALWRALDGKLRSQVRRPQKEGVTVRFGAGEMDAFYDVFSRHMRDLGTPTQPRRFFEAIRRAFPEDVWFGCAYLGDEPVAAGCGFRWGQEFEMTWASALASHKRLAPNMLLYWSFMERAADAGLRSFNFGRCSPGSGTHRFKQQWGTRDEQLYWYDWSGVERAPAKTPSPDDSAYSWGPRVWSRIPLAVANFLGPRIVRGIP